jgi:hypothetical protein
MPMAKPQVKQSSRIIDQHRHGVDSGKPRVTRQPLPEISGAPKPFAPGPRTPSRIEEQDQSLLSRRRQDRETRTHARRAPRAELNNKLSCNPHHRLSSSAPAASGSAPEPSASSTLTRTRAVPAKITLPDSSSNPARSTESAPEGQPLATTASRRPFRTPDENSSGRPDLSRCRSQSRSGISSDGC